MSDTADVIAQARAAIEGRSVVEHTLANWQVKVLLDTVEADLRTREADLKEAVESLAEAIEDSDDGLRVNTWVRSSLHQLKRKLEPREGA